MKIEFTKEQLTLLLQMINILNYPGSEIEKVLEIKNKVMTAINSFEEKIDLT